MSLEELERIIAERQAARQKENEELRARRVESALVYLEKRLGISPQEAQIISDDPVRIMVWGYILEPEYHSGRVAAMAVVTTDSHGNESIVGWATDLESLADAILAARESRRDQQPEESVPTCPFLDSLCIQEQCILWHNGMCGFVHLIRRASCS